ncbi:MAG TPA: NPCBM/NEW2 domain-containing protein [Chloroflexota bacterium]|nr:NPCBM/NEW2 domain-containing protein [Chloroflexota bacterium]
MLRNRKSLTPISLIITLVMALSTLLGPSRQALAAGPRVITGSDLADFNGIEGDNNGSISGATYAKGILMAGDKAFITLDTHHFPGYTAFTTAVGVGDGSVDDHPGTASVLVTVDGRLVKTITKPYGQAATILTVPFGQASQIKLTLHENQKKGLYILLGNPAVLTNVPKAAATPPAFGSGGGNGGGSGGGKTTLTLFSASVAAGSQETALITTGANAALTVVITYPGGTQQVLGPKKAGPDGHFAYSWTVPGGIAGVARVVVVSSGVAQATFTIP